MVLKKIAILIISALLLFFVGFAFFWRSGLLPGSLRLNSTVCKVVGGIVKSSCGFSECKSYCFKPSGDAYKPCSSAKQCKNGCFISSSDSQLGKMCQVNDIGGSYLCSSDIKLEGQCAPLDIPTLICSWSDFFHKYDYQLMEKGRVEPVFHPYGLNYACSTG